MAPTGILTLSGLTLRGGVTLGSELIAQGGGVRNKGTLTILDSIISHHSAQYYGGGIASSGTLMIDHSMISDNSAGTSSVDIGGGIGSTGLLVITHSTITRNGVNPAGSVTTYGGGIAAWGTLILTDSTISENRGSIGGGINISSGTAFITQTTIANNSVTSSGGGLSLFEGAVFITNTTIATNAGFGSGGLHNQRGQLEILNTILARNTSFSSTGKDCDGRVTSLGHNLIGDPAGCDIMLLASDLRGDPGLDAFTTGDGTPGHGHFPLLVTSQAINAGDSEACPTSTPDQVGFRRIGPCDIGAIEFQSPTPLPLTVTPTSVAAGDTVTAIWTGIQNPTPLDWLGLYTPGASGTAYLAWRYNGGTANGNVPFSIPGTLAHGTYELRLLANNGFTPLAISNPFTVTEDGGVTLTGSPSSMAAGGTVTATWSGIVSPTPRDWLGLYGLGVTNTNPLDWVYVSCTKTPGSARAAGSCPLPVDVGVSPGTYHLRLFANDGYTLLATSDLITVTAPAGALVAGPGGTPTP